jgi:oligogalacturonide transport system substrate-binding protein
MRKTEKKLLSLALAVAMAISLSGCGGGQKAEETAAAQSTGAQNTEAAQGGDKEKGDEVTITISWWGGDSRHEATLKALELFEEKYPNIKVEPQYGAWGGWLEQLSVQMAGNTEPDVMQINWNWIYEFSADGTGFTDLNQYADILELDQYPKNLLEEMSINGNLLGVPISTTGKVFYWNKTTFDKAGLEVPDSFEDMIEAGQVFKEKLGEDYYPMALTPYEQMLIMVYYLQQKYDKQWIVDRQVNFTQEEVADGIAFIRMLEDNHVFPSQQKLTSDGADTMDKNVNWMNGKYAGFYEWDSSQAKFANALEEGQEMVMGGYPYDHGETKAGTAKISMAYAISDTCEHPKEAALLISFLQGDPEAVKTQGTQRGIVSHEGAKKILEADGQLSDLTYTSNLAAMENAGFPLDPYFEDVKLKEKTGLYFEIFEAMSYDNTDPMELAELLIEGINQVQEKNK